MSISNPFSTQKSIKNSNFQSKIAQKNVVFDEKSTKKASFFNRMRPFCFNNVKPSQTNIINLILAYGS